MEMITEAVKELHLELVDGDWVQGIVDSEYVEFTELPPIYESVLNDINISTVFGNIIENVTLWLEDDSNQEGHKSWTKLKKYIQIKKVLTVLCYFMNTAIHDIMVKEYRDYSVLAARVYFKFLTIPGFKQHNIYHSQIFIHSLACLSYPRLLLEFDHTIRRVREVNVLLYELNEYVTDLHCVIVVLNLQPGDINYNEILARLLDGIGGALVNINGVDQGLCRKMINVVYKIIDVLIKDDDGRVCSETILNLFCSMLYKILNMCNDHSAVNLFQNSYISFIEFVINRYKESSLDSLHVLLQHICYRPQSLEKNDVRISRASVVLNVMSLLPQRAYCRFIKWLIKMTSYTHVIHRLMSLELLGRLLDASDYEALQELNDSQESGISMDGNISDSEDSSQNDGQNTVAASVRRSSSSGLEFQEIVEEPTTPVPRIINNKTIKYADLLVTFAECLHDVNAGVRMRALSLITKCATSRRPQLKKATEEFDKSGTGKKLMSIAVEMAHDERVVVKRAALELMLHGAKNQETLMMLVNLCRDSSVQVRMATISALTEWCLSNPEPAVLDAFVSGPLHQISDSEVKIQDQVISSVKQIMFDSLQPYEMTDANSQAWLLLEAITKRNKRNYLENACAMLVKKHKCINSKLITTLSTHLGKYEPADRSLHALVLLWCVGKYVNHADVQFLIQHFYNVVNSQRNDTRETVMCQELLSVWSNDIEENQRVKLRAFIIRNLEKGTLGRHGSAPTCLSLATQLDPDNLQWVTEDMNTLFQQMNEDSPPSLLSELADLSLVLPTRPPYVIMRELMKKLHNKDLDPLSSGKVVASIGRMSLRSYGSSHRAVAALGEVLLRRDGPLQPRVNALSALEDICSKHSGVVEPLMDTMCTCLEKEAPAVLRRRAARCITMLLLKQFLKIRTPLYFSYCALAMDSDPEVRELCLNYVLHHLESKVILNHFVDGVLYYNNSGPHAANTYNYIDEAARPKLYDLLLSRLSEQQRLQVICRLGTQVLSYVVEMCDEYPTPDDCLTLQLRSTLQESVTLINNLLLKTKRGKAAATDALDELDDTRDQPADNTAMSPKARRAIADCLIPGVVNLHSRLAPTTSTLVEPLTRIGKELMRDFKNEVDEFLSKGDMLSEQIKQFQEYVPSTVKVLKCQKRTTNEFREPARSRRRTISDAREPTPGPSRKRSRHEDT